MRNLDTLDSIVLAVDRVVDFGLALSGLGLIAYGLYEHNTISFVLGDAVAHLGLVMYLGDTSTKEIGKNIDFRGREGHLRNRRYNDGIREKNYDK